MAAEQTQDRFRHLERHSTYSFSDGNLHFMVEDIMFNVHRYFFLRESRVFRERLAAPAMPGGTREGDDESVAIILPEVPALAFEKFLTVFYNETFSLYIGWTIEDWAAVLKLALKWEFAQVQALAIRELEKMQNSVIQRIVLYQRYNLGRSLLVPLYSALCSQPEALTNEESEAIGMRTTVLVFRAREHLRARPSDGGMSPLPDELEEGDVQRAIITLLNETA